MQPGTGTLRTAAGALTPTDIVGFYEDEGGQRVPIRLYFRSGGGAIVLQDAHPDAVAAPDVPQADVEAEDAPKSGDAVGPEINLAGQTTDPDEPAPAAPPAQKPRREAAKA